MKYNVPNKPWPSAVSVGDDPTPTHEAPVPMSASTNPLVVLSATGTERKELRSGAFTWSALLLGFGFLLGRMSK